MDTRSAHPVAELGSVGMLEVTGDDARAFLHAQLTSDIAGLQAGQARYAGWCSAKGRLLASFLVVPHGGGFLLQLARDLASPMAKRLAMFVLRAKVKVSEASAAWAQFGLWGDGAESRLSALGLAAPQSDFGVSEAPGTLAVRLAPGRFVVAVQAARRDFVLASGDATTEQAWTLEEIRSGRALVTLATQDQFVPQMLDYQLLGAIDFRKGCYPGQEIVARTQYRGQLKRRLVCARVASPARAGQDVHASDLAGQVAGTVVNAASVSEEASELLAVVPIASLEQHAELRLGGADGPLLEVLRLPASS